MLFLRDILKRSQERKNEKQERKKSQKKPRTIVL